MKSLVHWGTTLGLTGITLLTPVLVASAPAVALTEAQLVKKLNDTPCFLITNNKGLPLTSQQTDKNGKKIPFTQVFMSGQEAQAFIDKLRQQKVQDPKKAEIFKTLQVTPVGMGQIYQKLRENAKEPTKKLQFAFQPGRQEVREAIALLKQQGKKIQSFQSVPLFIISAEGKGYISVKGKGASGKQGVDAIPMFFSKKDAEALLNKVKAKYSTAKIQVGDIDRVITVLRKNKDVNVVLVPPSYSLTYINQLQRKNANAQPAKPKR